MLRRFFIMVTNIIAVVLAVIMLGLNIARDTKAKKD